LAHETPVRTLRRPAGARRAKLHGLPVAADVGGVQVEAHRPEAALAGELQRVGALADAGHADRRVRLLERHDVRLEGADHRAGLGDVPVLALVIELRLVAPETQDDLERLARHLTVLPGIAVDVEHGPVARQPARRYAEVQ